MDITTNLIFWRMANVFGDGETTTVLLDRLTQKCHIGETGNELCRFTDNSTAAKTRFPSKEQAKEGGKASTIEAPI